MNCRGGLASEVRNLISNEATVKTSGTNMKSSYKLVLRFYCKPSRVNHEYSLRWGSSRRLRRGSSTSLRLLRRAAKTDSRWTHGPVRLAASLASRPRWPHDPVGLTAPLASRPRWLSAPLASRSRWPQTPRRPYSRRRKASAPPRCHNVEIFYSCFATGL